MSTYDSRESLMAAPMEEFEEPKVAPDGHYYGVIVRHPEWVDRETAKTGTVEILSYPIQLTEPGEDVDETALDGIEISSIELPYEFWVWNKTKNAVHSRGVMYYLRKFHASLGFDETLPNEQVLAETVGTRVLVTLGHDTFKDRRDPTKMVTTNRIREAVGAGNT